MRKVQNNQSRGKKLKTLGSVWNRLDYQDRRRSIFLGFAGYLTGLLELAGILGLIPWLLLLSGPDKIEEIRLPGYIIHFLRGVSPYERLIALLGFLAFIFLLKGVLQLWISHLQIKFTNKIAHQLSQKRMTAFLNSDYLKARMQGASQLINRAHLQTDLFSRSLLQPFIHLISEGLIILTVILIVSFYDALLLLSLILSFLPLVLIIYLPARRYAQMLGIKIDQLIPPAYKAGERVSAAHPFINLYGKARLFISKYLDLRVEIDRLTAQKNILYQVPRRMLELSGILGLLGITIYATVKQLEYDRLIVFTGIFLAAVYKVLPGLNRIIENFLKIREHQFALSQDDFETILPEKPNEASPSSEFQKLELKNISLSYDGKSYVLKNLNLKVNKGEILGIMGPSGCGKTTIMNIMLGFIEPTEGLISLNGKTLDKERHCRWQHRFGMVQDEQFLFEGNLISNIAVGEDEPDEERLLFAVKNSGVKEFAHSLTQVENFMIKENGVNLSAGQKQRIAIARALYFKADLIFLDEATNSLDRHNESSFLSIIKRLAESGTSFVLISHNSQTMKICDRIYYMD